MTNPFEEPLLTQASQPAPVLTFEKLCADIKKVMDELDACDPSSKAALPFGVPIMEDRFLVADFGRPAKVHKRRRWMSAAYHRRVQKKWTKRFGYKADNTVYWINQGEFGMPGAPCFVASRVVLAELRAAHGDIA